MSGLVPDSIQRMFKKSINKAEFSCNSYDRAVFGHLKEFLLKAGLLGEYNFDETHCSSLNASQQIDYLKTQLRGAYLGIHRLEQDSWENSIQQSAPDSRKSGRDKRELSSLETNHHPKPTIQTPNAERDSPTITNHTPVTQATKVESNPYSNKKDGPNRKAAPTAAKPKRNREDNAIKLLPEDVKEMSNLILQNHCIKCKANFHSKTPCKDEVSEERRRKAGLFIKEGHLSTVLEEKKARREAQREAIKNSGNDNATKQASDTVILTQTEGRRH